PAEDFGNLLFAGEPVVRRLRAARGGAAAADNGVDLHHRRSHLLHQPGEIGQPGDQRRRRHGGGLGRDGGRRRGLCGGDGQHHRGGGGRGQQDQGKRGNRGFHQGRLLDRFREDRAGRLAAATGCIAPDPRGAQLVTPVQGWRASVAGASPASTGGQSIGDVAGRNGSNAGRRGARPPPATV